jgi:hypothetical protein
MTPSRAAAYLGGGILLAAWFTSAAGVTRQPRALRDPRSSPQIAQLDTLAASVQSQASRLRVRLAAAPSPQSPIRNPFMFAARETGPRAAVPRVPEPRDVPAAEPVEIEPDLVLLGVAEQDKTRTALIGAGEELIMVTEGQSVAGRYRVAAVSADGVELKDLATGATRRLTLRSPASPL